MKTFSIKALCLSLAMLPAFATAQTNIKKTFDALIDHQKAEVTQNHELRKDPQTGAKESQCDIYKFVLSKKQEQLITDIQKAFRTDSENAYLYATGEHNKKDDNYRPIALATGNDNGNGVVLAKELGMKYIYACFLAPEDTAGNHRYAYAIEWKKTGNDEEFIVGTLVVTYATTQKYRQESRVDFIKSKANPDGTTTITTHYNGGLFDMRTEGLPWFRQFTSYITQLSSVENSAARQMIATRIYEHTQNLKNVSARDKNTAREILKTTIGSSKDELVDELLNASLINIK